MRKPDNAADARKQLLAVLKGGEKRLAFELFKAAKKRDQRLTYGLLQNALVQLIADRQVQVDDRLRVAEASRSS